MPDLMASSGTLQGFGRQDRSHIPVSVTQENTQNPINQLLASFLSILLSNGGQTSIPQLGDASTLGHLYNTHSQPLPPLTHQGSTVSSSFQPVRSLNLTRVPTVHLSDTQSQPQPSSETLQSRSRSTLEMEGQQQVNALSQPRDSPSNQVSASEAVLQHFLPVLSSSLFQSLPVEQQIFLFNQLLQNPNGVVSQSEEEVDPDRLHSRKK